MKIYVEKYRLEQGLTLTELSKRSGVAISHIHNIENGTKVPTIEVLCKLAKGLNIPCSDLFSCED